MREKEGEKKKSMIRLRKYLSLSLHEVKTATVLEPIDLTSVKGVVQGDI